MVRVQPALILVSQEHAAFLLDEFGRYTRDYDLHTAGSCAEALELTRSLTDAGGSRHPHRALVRRLPAGEPRHHGPRDLRRR
ncbi:MAG: hypothetical protein Q8O61_11825 [Nocardioides sp.]|nr:hypothetical protein [Nocardioides sp.]